MSTAVPLSPVASAKPPSPGGPATATPEVDKEQLRKLMQPSFWQWTIRVAIDWTMIVVPLVIAGVTRHWAAYAFAVLMCGIGQHRLAIMAHEGAHRQITRNKRLNDFLTGFFCLWPFGNPVGAYRRFHFSHHRYLNTEDDAELRQKVQSTPAYDLPATRWTILKYFVRDVCLLHWKELVSLSQRVRPGIDLKDGSWPNLWMLAAVGMLLYFGQWWVIVVWYLGTAMVFWPIFRLRLWSEHVGTDDAHRIHAPWYTRLWMLPHNTWCHYEHHRFPQVPCWNLVRLRKLMGPSPKVIPLTEILVAIESAPPTKSGAPFGSTVQARRLTRSDVPAEVEADWEAKYFSGEVQNAPATTTRTS